MTAELLALRGLVEVVETLLEEPTIRRALRNVYAVGHLKENLEMELLRSRAVLASSKAGQ